MIILFFEFQTLSTLNLVENNSVQNISWSYLSKTQRTMNKLPGTLYPRLLNANDEITKSLFLAKKVV